MRTLCYPRRVSPVPPEVVRASRLLVILPLVLNLIDFIPSVNPSSTDLWNSTACRLAAVPVTAARAAASDRPFAAVTPPFTSDGFEIRLNR